ncbi:unnamed protein product [Zymoseptoria tritici ST99CH_1A5]|uniref:C2H2-type domain-containing protein n=1 Tax=Zymoseptoria tritici ST99CH_1A5 TaxID=1276529 RepID=A0A1Y6LAU1_ZYMTR|nr:unnamed protein product [Zymoseptoria tritici ST99CH_1A5]
MSQATIDVPSRKAERIAFQDKPIACTVEWCQHRFDTWEDMHYHKKREPDHFYCSKCRLDCEDWDSQLAHKVDNMAPYLEGRKKVDDDLKHITCEFCGEDFKSFGGRKRHRTQSHPANQDIRCPGCPATFIKATYFIDHLERNQCANIRAHEFLNRINHKYIVKQLLEGALSSLEYANHGHEHNLNPGAITDGEETLDQDNGGVSLLDDQNEAQLSGYKAMDPESSTGSSTKSPQPAQESWPRMPQSLSTATASMRSMSISERAPPIGAKKGILKTPRTPQPTNPLIDRTVTPAESISQGGSVASSEATTVAASEKPRPMAWNSGKTASSLFPAPKERQIVNPGDWGGYLVATRSSNDANQVEQPNMFRTQFWNITSKEYNVQQFWSELLNAYFCPFPSCADGTGKYSAASDIEAHIRLAHTMTCYRCPLCLKRFDRVAKLVGHVETSMKCRVKYSDQFDSFLDEITGGFLKSKNVGEPKIYRPETALVKHGQQGGGVMATVFEAKHPDVKW